MFEQNYRATIWVICGISDLKGPAKLSGQPSTGTASDTVEHVWIEVEQGRFFSIILYGRLTVRELDDDLVIPKRTVLRILTESLWMTHACAKFIPKLLSAQQEMIYSPVFVMETFIRVSAKYQLSKLKQRQINVDCFLLLWRLCTPQIYSYRSDDQQKVLRRNFAKIAWWNQKKASTLLANLWLASLAQ